MRYNLFLFQFSGQDEKTFLSKSKEKLKLAKQLLETEDVTKLSWREFFNKMNLEGDEEQQSIQYHKYLSVTERGMIFIHKRGIDSGYINNYNEEMLICWNGNMDIQLAMDTYAVTTYILGYISKDESGM